MSFARMPGIALAGLIVTACACVSAHAQTYPEKQIRIILPYPPGASGDILARMIGNHLSEKFGKVVVVENRTGGSGVPATQAVARAEPDGYTLLLTGLNHVSNVGLYESLPYNPVSDFEAVSLLGSVRLALVSSPSKGFKDIHDLIAKAKAKPKHYTFASGGNGSGGHLSMELFVRTAGISALHAPYRGATPAMNDVLAGHVDLSFQGIPPVLPFIRDGRLQSLVVTSPKRIPTLPDTPTGEEIGLKDFDVDVWFGLLAPAGTPRAVIELLAKAASAFIRLPDTTAKLDAQGLDPVGSSADEFAAIIRKDVQRWPQIIRDSGIKAQ